MVLGLYHRRSTFVATTQSLSFRPEQASLVRVRVRANAPARAAEEPLFDRPATPTLTRAILISPVAMPTLRKRLLRCIALGFVIEAPMFWWYMSVRDALHTASFVLLTLFHIVSLSITYWALSPLFKRVSESAIYWPGYAMIGILQAMLIGGLIFIFVPLRERPRED
jgi:hypothetical protein